MARLSRKEFLVTSGIGLFAPSALLSGTKRKEFKPENPYKIKLTLNAYSFNAPLRSGEMSVDDLLEAAAKFNFDAVDLTAYYIPEYPKVPSDKVLYEIKRKAFLLGLDISGTGVRNDFTIEDKTKRNEQFDYIEGWIRAATVLDAPVVRIFAGRENPEGYTWKEKSSWVVEGIQRCCELGEKYGVLIALQNHNDFIFTAEQCLEIYHQIDSSWFGLMVDIGSLRQSNPYEETKKLAPYAITWQIKENVYFNEKVERTDFKKIIEIVKNSGYRGYLPVETLGEGDPHEKIKKMLQEITEAL